MGLNFLIFPKEIMMATDKEKKGIFGKAIDAMTSRDEKAALEEAQQQMEEVQKQLEEAKKEAARAKAQASSASSQMKAEAEKAIAEAEKRAAEAEAKAKTLADKIAREDRLEQQRKDFERRMQQKEAAAPKFIAEHTLTAEETLSHLSLKYYGHATKPYWMVIYEANKDVIGDNPNRVRPGLEIKIPELPEELKDK
jgi:nucleoid-associated protein YgaU